LNYKQCFIRHIYDKSTYHISLYIANGSHLITNQIENLENLHIATVLLYIKREEK